MTPEELRAGLDAWIGREGEPSLARDAVNPAMIRHWCDAVGDENPVYTDRKFAAKSDDSGSSGQGVAAGELRIRRGSAGRALRPPPGPMCPHCQSLDWDAIVSAGRGHVFSFVVAHHPPVPPFSYPNAIALIELDE